MAEGFKLGAAYVSVSPDTEGFKDKLQADLDADKAEIKVKVSPDTTDFKTRLDAALAKAKEDSVDITAKANTDEFTAKIDETLAKRRSTTVDVKYDKSQVSQLGSDAGSDFSKAFNDGVNSGGSNAANGSANAGAGGGGFAGAMPLLAGGGIAAGVTAALSILPAAATAVGSLAGIGLGAAITDMAMTRITTLKTNIATLQSSLGSATKGTAAYNSDEAQLKQQQALLASMASMEKLDTVITKLGNDGETALFKGVQPLIGYFISGAGQLEKFLPTLSSMLGKFFAAVGPSVGPLISSLEKIVSSVLPAFTDLLAKNQPAIKEFYTALGDVGSALGGFITAMGPGVADSMKIFVSLLGDLDNILVSVGIDATVASTQFGGPIIKALSGLSNLIQTLLLWVTELGGALMPLIATLSNAFAGLLNSAMPIIMPLLTALIGIVDNLISILMPFVDSLLNALRPLVPVVLQIVDAFGKFAGTVLMDLVNALAPLIPILSQILLDLLKPLAQLFSGTLNSQGKEFGQVMKALTPSLVELAESLLKLVVQMTPLIELFVKLNAATLEGEAIFMSKFIPVLADVIKYAVQLTSDILDVIGVVAKWAAAGKNWQEVWSVSVNWMHSTWSQMVNWVHQYWSDMVNWISSSWNKVYTDTRNWWNDTVNWLHSIWSDSVNWLKDIWTGGINWLRDTWNDVYDFAKQIWTDIANWFRQRWEDDINLLKTVWADARTWLKGTWTGFENDAKDIWNDIHNWFTGFWNREIDGWKNIINGVRSWLKGAWGDIKNDAVEAWDAISAGIGNAFNKVENAVKHPITVVLGDVDKFDALINHIPGVKLPTNLSFAGGGVLPGYAPGRDTVDAKLSLGESVLVPELTAKIGPANIMAANYAASGRPATIGPGSYAGGGWNPVSAVINAGKTAGSDISSAVQTASGAVTNLWNDTTNLIANPVSWIAAHAKSMLMTGVGSGTLGSQIASGAVSSVVNDLKSIVGQSATVNDVNYKPGAGVAQWKPDVLKALTLNGLSSALANQVLYQMTTESGGNPNAINLWDSNAAAGDPSRGLMQVIATTFSAYHVPGTSENILDPLANIAAAINYAKHTYGPTLERDGMGLGSGHGYASGGNAPAGDTAWVGENGPELVRFGAAAHVTPTSQATGGIHFHEGSIIINGRMSSQDVQRLKSQLADAIAGYNV